MDAGARELNRHRLNALCELPTVYCSDDHVLIRPNVEKLNQAAVRDALKGTQI